MLEFQCFYFFHLLINLTLFALVYPTGDDLVCSDGGANSEARACPQKFRKLLVFSGNDYLGLSSHPSVAKAAAKVCLMTIEFHILYLRIC